MNHGFGIFGLGMPREKQVFAVGSRLLSFTFVMRLFLAFEWILRGILKMRGVGTCICRVPWGVSGLMYTGTCCLITDSRVFHGISRFTRL